MCQEIVEQGTDFIIILTQTRMLRAYYRGTPKLQAGRSKKGKDNGSKEGRKGEKERKEVNEVGQVYHLSHVAIKP